MVTGHSLGGGLANIIGSHLGIPSVAFSAPGLGYSIYNYNVSLDAAMRYTMNIVPLPDPVPKFDLQLGLLEYLECDAGQPIACHKLRRTIRSLIEMCGI
jgi:hypothetical protein